LEKLAHQIRNRSILQLGRLIKEIEPQRGQRSDLVTAPTPGRDAAARKAGVAERQQKTANQVAGLTEN